VAAVSHSTKTVVVIYALSARESALLSKKDAAGIASLFTSDGLLVMLAPQFAFKPGRDAVQKHYPGIIDAGATSITLELKNMELRGNDGVWAADPGQLV
jgi:ketosteroid isomerase-like protein